MHVIINFVVSVSDKRARLLGQSIPNVTINETYWRLGKYTMGLSLNYPFNDTEDNKSINYYIE